MNRQNIPIALLALFTGALALYIYSQGQQLLGGVILALTIGGTFLVTRNRKPPVKTQGKSKKKKKRR